MKLFLTLLLGVCSVAYGQTLRANTKVVLPDSTRDIASRLSDTLSVKDYGAKADGATDDTAAINAALTAGAGKVITVPAGNYAINGSVTVPASTVLQIGPGTYTLGNLGQIKLAGTASKLLCTGGPENTVLVVPSSYAVTDGVIALTSGEPAGTVEGCAIRFSQPDVSTLSGLIHYAAAGIYAVNAPRFRVLRCKIVAAWNGVNMTGNSGGALIDDLQISSFHNGIQIDGSFDTVRINHFHWWVFGLTGNQQIAASDTANIGILSGRCDGLHLVSPLFFGGQGLSLYSSASGTTFGLVTDAGFDNFSGLLMSAGNLAISSSYFSLGVAAGTSIKVTGGKLALSSISFNENTGVSFLDVSGAGTIVHLDNATFAFGSPMGTYPVKVSSGAQVSIDSSEFNQTVLDMTTMANTGGYLSVRDCHWDTSAIAFANPLVRFTSSSSRGIIADNTMSDQLVNNSKFFKADVDSWIIVHDNSLLNWGVSVPGGATSILSHDNN